MATNEDLQQQLDVVREELRLVRQQVEEGRRQAQCALHPPSIMIDSPVMNPASGPHR